MFGGARYLWRGFAMWRRRPGLMLLGAVPALLVLVVLLAAVVTEVVMTMMFLIVILGATDPRAPQGFAPIAPLPPD